MGGGDNHNKFCYFKNKIKTFQSEGQTKKHFLQNKRYAPFPGLGTTNWKKILCFDVDEHPD